MSKKYQDHCDVEGCDRGFYARGYCNMHYLRSYDGQLFARDRAVR